MNQEIIDMEEKRPPVKKKKNILRFVIIIGISLIAIALISSYLSYRYVTASADSKNKTEVVKIDRSKGISVDIPLGSGTKDIAKILKEKGIINFPTIFKIVSFINGYDGTYKAGIHILNKDLSYDEIMRVLGQSPESASIKVRIPEYYTFNQTVELLKKKGLIDEAKFRDVANNTKFDYSFLKGIPKRENRLEGYLFPDTYFFNVGADEEEIIKTMLDRFDEIFKKSYYARAKALHMTVDQIVTLASIIEREAKVDSERKVISGVFYNRLNNSDPTLRKLQSCATVEYILLNETGKVKEKLTDQDTSIQSPYNTYQVEGLPLGPICSPSEKSIIAALYPQKNQYLYFVVKGDGSGEHYFSKTYSEHLIAVSKSIQ